MANNENPDHNTENPQAPLAGVVVSPGEGQASNAQPPISQPEPEPQQDTNPDFIYQAEETNSAQPTDDNNAVTWTASEFIAHQKSAGWYGLLALGTVIASVAIYLLFKDVISVLVVVVGALALGYFAARQPRQLQYQIDGGGITIGQKHFEYDAFRSFSIVPEGAFSSIIFMPLKRFSPLTTIYFAPDDEKTIVDMLTPRLPFEEYKHDAVDRFMRRIRF